MSESRANLEQILELLLAEENEQAEELLHEYVVAKARQQYERVLDESEEVDEELDESKDEEDDLDESSCGSKKKHNEEEEVDETIDHSDPSADYVEDVTAIEDAVEADEFGEGDDEDDGEMDMDGDVEDKIDDLEDELAALKAEFEKLMSDDDDAEDDAEDAMDAAMDADADEIEFDDQEMESVEYELDEDFEDQIDEATKLSDQTSPQSTTSLDVPDPGADNNQSPFTSKPGGTAVEGAGKPVVIKDGGEGDHGESGSANPQDPGDHNIDVEHKSNAPQQTKEKLSVPNPGEDGSNGKSPFTKSPR
jgi:hypothetical protein